MYKQISKNNECAFILTGSLDWLCCKTLRCGVSCVIQDLSLCTDLKDCPEIQMLKETFLLLKPSLDFSDGRVGKY